MRPPVFRPILAALVLALPAAVLHAQNASGVQPEASVLLLSEEDGQAQMALRNGEATPLLLHTRVYDVEEKDPLVLVPLPPVTRIEARSRQVVRFVLEPPAQPLAVQHYKRVTFEGIPPRTGRPGESRVQVNVRYDLPVVISPRGLAPLDDPWVKLQWRLDGRELKVRNDSPYVVRLSREVDLLPAVRRIEVFRRTVVLPGESVAVALPQDVVPGQLTGVRLFPATLYGYSAADYDAPLSR